MGVRICVCVVSITYTTCHSKALFSFPPDGNWQKKGTSLLTEVTLAARAQLQRTQAAQLERGETAPFSLKTRVTSSEIWQRHSGPPSFHLSNPDGIVFWSLCVFVCDRREARARPRGERALRQHVYVWHFLLGHTTQKIDCKKWTDHRSALRFS